MFKIGDFARLNKVSIKTLRHYDSLGLLRPEKIDTLTGYRYYSACQMPRLNKILMLKEVCFSLEEIASILDKDMVPEQIQTILELKQFEIAARIKSDQERLSRVKNLLNLSKEEAFHLNYDILLKKIEPIQVASLRDFVPGYSQQGPLWRELFVYLRKHKVKVLQGATVIYHYDKSTNGSIDTEIIVPIGSRFIENDRIKCRLLEGVTEAATLVHKGSYQTLHLAYEAMSNWIEENEYEIVQPPREVYLKGHLMINDPNGFITMLQFPVFKAIRR